MATLNGTGGADILNGTSASDLIYGKSGNDIIFTGVGNDTVYGGAGNDRIVIGSGTNILYGGVGQDVFEVADGATGVGVLRDWQDGQDKIDLSDLGIASLDDLTIRQAGVWTVIDTGDVDLRIKTSQLGGGLSAEDFVFAQNGGGADGNTFAFDFDNLPQWVDTGVIDGFAFDGYIATPFGANGPLQPGDPAIAPIFTEWGGRTDTSISRADNFDFESFEAIGMGADQLILVVTGFDNGAATGTQEFLLQDDAMSQFFLNDAIFDSVDRVEFDVAIAPGSALYGGLSYVLDDVLIFG